MSVKKFTKGFLHLLHFLAFILVNSKSYSQIKPVSTGALLHIDSSNCYIIDNFLSTNWGNNTITKNYNTSPTYSGWYGSTSAIATIPAKNLGNQATANGVALNYSVAQIRASNYNDSLGIINLKNLYQSGNANATFPTFAENQVQSFLQLPTLPSVGKMILFVTTKYGSSSLGFVVESKQPNGTWVQVASVSYPSYNTYIQLDTIAGNNIVSQTPVTYRIRSNSYNSTNTSTFGPQIGALLVQKYIPNDAYQPPYRPFNAVSSLSTVLTIADSLVNKYSESQWLELVPKQAPRSLQLNPSSDGKPDVSTWYWFPDTPNQIRDGKYIAYQYGSSPKSYKNQVMTGDTVLVPYYITVSKDTTYVDAQIDYQKMDFLNNNLPILGSAYQRSGNEKYARYVALALNKWSKNVPKYFMTLGWNLETPIDRDKLLAKRTTVLAQRASDHNGLTHELEDGPILAFDYIYESVAIKKIAADSGYNVLDSIRINFFLNITNWLINVPTMDQHVISNLMYHISNMIRVAEVCGDTTDKKNIMTFVDAFFDTVQQRNFKRDGILSESFSYHEGYAKENYSAAQINSQFYYLFKGSDYGLSQAAINSSFRTPFFYRTATVQDSVAFPTGDLAPFDDTQADNSIARDSTQSYLLPAYGHAMLGSGKGNQQTQLNFHLIDYANHVHNGNLGITLFANGNEQLGNIRYSRIAGRIFTNSAIAKNLVVVDQNTNQYNAAKQVFGNSGHVFTNGYITMFEPNTDSISVTEGYSNNIYGPSLVTRYQRLNILNTVDLTAPYLIDVFVVKGGTNHDYVLNGSTQIDQTYTSSLPLARSTSTTPLLPAGKTYTRPINEADDTNWYGALTAKDSAQSNGNWQVTFKNSTGTDGVKVFGLDDGSPMINIAQSPVAYRRSVATTFDYYKRPALIEQRVGTSANSKSIFVHVIEPFGSASAITSVTKLPLTSSTDEFLALSIQFANGRKDVALINLNHELITGDSAKQTITTLDSMYTIRGKVGIFTNVNSTVKGYLFNGRNLVYNKINYTPSDSVYSGTITGTLRKAKGDDYDAFITDAIIPEGVELKGKWISLRFGTYTVVNPPVGAVTTQSGMNELFQIDGIKKVNGKTYILTSFDHLFSVVGNITKELVRPQRTFVGTTTFTINKTKAVVYANNAIIFTPPVLTPATIARIDSNYSITFNDDATWRAAITTVSFGTTTLTSPTDYTLSAGLLTINPNGLAGSLLRTPGTYKIKISATNYFTDSVVQTVAVGLPKVLSIVTQPSGINAYSGVLTTQPIINILDLFNNLTTSAATITADVYGGSNWTVGGTTSTISVNGIATFTGLSVSATTIVNNATIQFSAVGFTTVYSNSFTISPPIYYWVGGSTSNVWNAAVWSTSLGGTPLTGFTPAKTDVYIFDGNDIGGGVKGTITVGATATTNVGKVILRNNANVVFSSTAARSYLINGLIDGDDFIIESGSTLTTSGANTTNIQILSGATARISGNFYLGQGSSTHSLLAADYGAVQVNSGGIITVQSFTSTVPFTGTISSVSVKDSSVIFNAGSKLVNKVAGDVFGGTGFTTIAFLTGSTYEIQTNTSGSMAFDGRSFSNVIYNYTSTGTTVAGSNGFSIDNLSVLNKSLTITATGSNNHIKGNINVASASLLIFNPASASTVVLDGTSLQTISISGTLSIPALQTIQINNAAGVSLNNSITTTGNILLTNGNIHLGANNLIATSISGGNSNSFVNTNGTGRLYINSIPTNTATIFPVGINTTYNPLTITRTSTTASNISVGFQSTIANTVSNSTAMLNAQWNMLSSAAATLSIVYQFNNANKAANFNTGNACELGTYNSSYSTTTLGIPSSLGNGMYSLTKTALSLAANTNYYYVIGNTNAVNTSCVQGTWFGADGADANLASNWCISVLPTATTNVIINTTSPKLTANLSVNNCSLLSGINLNGNTLTINGVVSGTGTITGSTTSSLNVLGSGTLYFNQQNAGTSNSLNSLTINTSGTVTVGNSLNIIGTLKPQLGTLNANGNITLIATATSMARVPQGSGTIVGNVTTQLFIPAKSSRQYSFIGSAVSQTIRNAWQQNIYITGVGTGGQTCGSTNGNGTIATDKYNNNGFDVTSKNTPTMFTYNAVLVNGNRWVSIPNTNATSLIPGVGYRVNVRGDRNTNNCLDQLNGNNPLPPNNVVLNATGVLSQGDVTVALNDTTKYLYSLVANPYYHPISFNALQASNTTIANKMWTQSPIGNGNYSTYSNGVFVNAANGYSNAIGHQLATGQAFIVEANKKGTTLTFKETNKIDVTLPNLNYFGTSNQKRIRLGLYTNSDSLLDEIVVRYNSNGSKSYLSDWDAVSFNTGKQSLASLKKGVPLAIATRNELSIGDTISILFKSSTVGQFVLKLSEMQGFDAGTGCVLKDNYLQTQQNLLANASYNITATSDTASYGKNRLEILLNSSVPLANNLYLLTATLQSNSTSIALLQWNIKYAALISECNVEKSNDGIIFTTIYTTKVEGKKAVDFIDKSVAPTAFYRIKMVNKDGKTWYSNTVKLVSETMVPASITLFPNPIKAMNMQLQFHAMPAGKYQIAIVNSMGIKCYEQNMQHVGAEALYTLPLNPTIAQGIYQLCVYHAGENKLVYQTKMMVE